MLVFWHIVQCCNVLTRPVASVMVGELCGMGVPLWLLGIPLMRLSRSVPSKLWRGLLRKPWRPALGDEMEEPRLCSSALAGSCRHKHTSGSCISNGANPYELHRPVMSRKGVSSAGALHTKSYPCYIAADGITCADKTDLLSGSTTPEQWCSQSLQAIH